MRQGLWSRALALQFVNADWNVYIRYAYFSGSELYGVMFKHLEPTHPRGDNLFQLLEGVRLERQPCETLGEGRKEEKGGRREEGGQRKEGGGRDIALFTPSLGKPAFRSFIRCTLG